MPDAIVSMAGVGHTIVRYFKYFVLNYLWIIYCTFYMFKFSKWKVTTGPNPSCEVSPSELIGNFGYFKILTQIQLTGQSRCAWFYCSFSCVCFTSGSFYLQWEIFLTLSILGSLPTVLFFFIIFVQKRERRRIISGDFVRNEYSGDWFLSVCSFILSVSTNNMILYTKSTIGLFNIFLWKK